MPRIKIRAREEMTEEQRRVYDATVAGKRGRAPAPLIAWLESPVLADRAQKLGEFVRYETSLPPRLSELAILVMARHWTAQFEWTAHKKEALKGGLDPAIIDDIANRRLPGFKNEDERVVYDFSVTLNTSHTIPDGLYRTAVDTIGTRGVVDLVGILGYYTLISMTLNTFEIDPPDGQPAELKP
jgi:4-carboxymuconolactone decarboxylase